MAEPWVRIQVAKGLAGPFPENLARVTAYADQLAIADKFASPEEAKAGYDSNKVTWDQAAGALRNRFGYQ